MFWKFLDSVDLDPGLLRRFEDQTMAVVGYEANVVWSPQRHIDMMSILSSFHSLGATK